MRRAFIIISICVVILAGVTLGAGYFWLKSAYQTASSVPVDTVVLIKRGSGIAAISNQLKKDGLINDTNVFRYGLRFFDDQRPLRAGEYKVPAGASPAEIARILKEAEPITYRITFAEGLTSSEIVDILRDDSVLVGDIEAVPAEGSLLPETYHFHRGETRMGILARMTMALDRAITKAWDGRQANLPLNSPDDALILASIVEKETGIDNERGQVAGVFINRIRKGMRLQSDPTVVYGITMGAGPLGRGLKRSELDAKTAYNTYQISGLPPTPIANPGLASIEAVLNPDKTDALYFVADGTGGHAFSKTLPEHNRNVRAWRKIERARKKN